MGRVGPLDQVWPRVRELQFKVSENLRHFRANVIDIRNPLGIFKILGLFQWEQIYKYHIITQNQIGVLIMPYNALTSFLSLF